MSKTTSLSSAASVRANFGTNGVVEIGVPDMTPQVRLTFTSSEVGNGSATDSNTMAGQDGGLAVRLQAEDGSGDLTGPVSRLSDEGVTFTSRSGLTFDVRDLVSGVQRGDFFDVVQLGTSAADVFDQTGRSEDYYINAGMGNDMLTGGLGRDFLVGGAGDDTLSGREGNDSFIGGLGNDQVFGGGGDDTAIVNLSTDGADAVDLGAGSDVVLVAAPAPISEVRLTFTSSEVGNGSATDSNTMANQDGGLAVRLQAENASGRLSGPISRYDDEGITFVSTTPGVTFDVRDLVSGVQRGDTFDVVQLGTNGDDVFDQSGKVEAYYINAGMGNDELTGGLDRDFLVGGVGDDTIDGREGRDSAIGGMGSDTFVFSGQAGNDRVLDFASGTDTIDLTDFGIDFDDVLIATSGSSTLVRVNTDNDNAFEFQISLTNGSAVSEADFAFA